MDCECPLYLIGEKKGSKCGKYGENVICMENIFGTTAKLTDLQGNAIPYKMEDELLRFTVNAKGTAPVAVRVQI